jgi:hypothetical protein
VNRDSSSLLARARRRVRAFADRPWLVAACLGIMCLATGAVMSSVNWPEPRVHDEFSYLLAADTFAHGRLTNPTHPKWEHFETFHVIQQPSYASKYPPGQGAVLGAAQWITGVPLVGIWCLSAVAATATYWMLLGWTSRRYALLGALLWVAHPGIQLAWGQSYWGGTLAFLGGALVFGAALRMLYRIRVVDAVAMASGAVILAVSRPFEGFLFCSITGLWVLLHWARHGGPRLRDLALKLAAPQAIIIALGGVALGAYHHAVTGNATTFPYFVHEATYGQCPMFVGGKPAAKPAYRHSALDNFHSGWELDWYHRQSTPRSWLYTKMSMSWLAAGFFISPVMAAGLLLVRPLRWPRVTPVVIVGGLAFLASLASTWNLSHYMAPFAPLLFIGAASGLRRADMLSDRLLAGFRLATALVALQVISFGIVAAQVACMPKGGWWVARQQIVEQLRESPQRHLILVKYGVDHSPINEWVYNDADIDNAKVVWARSMSAEKDADLLRYFGDRQAWLLEPDEQKLTPMAPTAVDAAPADSAGSISK